MAKKNSRYDHRSLPKQVATKRAEHEPGMRATPIRVVGQISPRKSTAAEFGARSRPSTQQHLVIQGGL